MTEIISRKEAIERGLKRYFTGKPCKRGHVTARITPWGTCCDCVNVNARQQRAKDPEKFRERVRAFYAKHSEKHKKRNRDLYAIKLAEDPEKFREQQRRYWRAYYKKHHEERKAQCRKYYIDHREKCNAKQREYRENNIYKIREHDRARAIKNRKYRNAYNRQRKNKITDMIAVLRVEMPELLKEFDL